MSSSSKVGGSGPHHPDELNQNSTAGGAGGGGGARKVASAVPPAPDDPYLNRVAQECAASQSRLEGVVSKMLRGDSARAQEIVAEAITRVKANAINHRDESEINNVGGVLYRAARNLVIDYKRRKRVADRVNIVGQGDKAYEAALSRGDRWAGANEIISRIAVEEVKELALGDATPRERTLFDLWFIAGMTSPEIARYMGVTPPTVRHWQAKLLAKVQSNMRDLM